jgi:hypothetical protein
MKKICLGCLREYSDLVWFHPKLKICGICYNIHKYSEVKFWNGKKWVEKEKKITDFA